MAYESSSNPMTEIALALAMAFFSIMVLAMISMGGAFNENRSSVKTVTSQIKLAMPAAEVIEEDYNVHRANPETLLIYWKRNLYDGALNPIEDTSLLKDKYNILAISPDLSISAAMTVQKKLNIKNHHITTLSKNWVEILNEKMR